MVRKEAALLVVFRFLFCPLIDVIPSVSLSPAIVQCTNVDNSAAFNDKNKLLSGPDKESLPVVVWTTIHRNSQNINYTLNKMFSYVVFSII